MKNNKRLLVLCALVIFAGLIACSIDTSISGNGNVIHQERMAEGFNGIVLDGIGNIDVHFSENHKVVVTTDSNIQDYVTVKTVGTLLHIDEKHGGNGLKPTRLIIDIYLLEIKSINLEGLGHINVDKGTGDDLELYLPGVGDINTSGYQARNVLVYMKGVGTIKTWATDSLNGSLTGVGDVFYKGNPARNVKVTGLGRVKSL
jgi:hypothetical protein